MIDEQRTYEKYKYYSTDLDTKSHKKIIAICDGCGRIKDYPKSSYTPYCHACKLKTPLFRLNSSLLRKGKPSSKKGKKYGPPKNKAKPKYPILTKEYLVEEHINKKLSPKDISNNIGIDYDIVLKYLNKFKIFVKRKIKYSKETNDKRTASRLKTCEERGYYHSEESKKNIGIKNAINMLGNVPWNAGALVIETRKCQCSPECKETFDCPSWSAKKMLDEHKSIFYIGKNNPSWEGGITPLRKSIRGLIQSTDWRNSCFIRDNYTCQKCFKVGGYLEVDHNPKPFSNIFMEFLQHYSEYDPIKDNEVLIKLSKTWEPFWDINNGKTLCEDCHEGRKKETLKTIKEFKDKIKEQNINAKI